MGTISIDKIISGRVSIYFTSPPIIKCFLSQEKINDILNQNNQLNATYGSDIAINKMTTTEGIVIEDIKGKTITGEYRGKVMLITDPKRVKLAITKNIGVVGERVSELVKDTGAIGGINAGGFYDPDTKGNGAYPDGLAIHEGKIYYNNVGNKEVNIIGIDKEGKLIVGNISSDEVESKNIEEAVMFGPNLIVNGNKANFNNNEWGVAPRTAIGQKADGTIIFVVIDGRQPTWSMGAQMNDLYNIFLKYGAVNAANLDGGSSSEMYYNGKIINKLWNIFGERYIPTAFVVMPAQK